MRRYVGIALFSLLIPFLSLLSPALGKSSEGPSTTLSAVHYLPEQNSTRIVFELSNPTTYFDKHLAHPARVYIDLHDTFISGNISPIKVGDGVIKQIRTRQHDRQTVRVVLELTGSFDYKIFPLTSPDRLVVDIFREGQPLQKSNTDTIRTIVIDPGHGGKDPGATGKHGLMEKDIVLDVGLRLQRLVRDKLGAKVIMTRDEDVFIPLEERTAIANAKGADLFISVHANSSRKAGTRGVETYLLGKASDKNAMDTALRENSAGRKPSDDLQLILTDLLTTAKKDESLRLAHYVQSNIIDRLEPGYKAVNLGVKQAPFFVLVHASMPSILAEISFISNPAEERLLSEGEYRQEIAEAIFEGIRRYVQSTPMLSQPDEARNITIR